MRIAYATDQPLPRTDTDAEQLVSMASALGAAGASVELLVPANPFRAAAPPEEVASFYGVAPAFQIRAVAGLTPSFRGLEKVAHGVAVARSEAAQRADVLYTRNLPTVVSGLRFGSRPVVYETYRPWPQQRPRQAPLFRWIFRHPRFRGAVLHSTLAADSFRTVGATDDQLLVAHNGYNPTRMQPVLSQEAARQAAGLPPDRPIVVYTGHVSLAKGLGLVLDLAGRLPAALFVIVGSKKQGPVEARAAAMENVRIVPWQPFRETMPYLYAADVLLIPPTRGPLEAAGNTVLPMKTFLYMASGRAIFAPSTPDVCEVLEDGHSARLVPPDEPEIAVRALGALLADDALRVRLADAARRSVWTWQERAARVLAFIAR